MSKRCTNEEFIKKAKEIHGDIYDYSIVDYKNAHVKVKIICSKHGIFEQKPNNHLSGKGCSVCGYFYQNKDIFIQKAKEIHGDTYNYSLVDYQRSNQKVIIICKEHGEFSMTPNNHLRKQGCPKCKISKGESSIEKWLVDNNINYTSQKRFKECRSKQPLPFDFYLPDHNICIEFDGEQHFRPYRYRTDKDKFIDVFNRTKNHDEIKNDFCKVNNIKLVRIPYTKINEINEILKDTLWENR